MKVTRADVKELRLAIAAAAIMIILGIGCVAVSDYYLGQARNENAAAKQRRLEAQKRVEQVAEEEREIRRNLVSYQSMVSRGMASEQNRLDIIDEIARIKKERRLFEIRYDIEPQKPLSYPGMHPAGPLDFVGSRMKLEMLLLHEQDLLGFLDDLIGSAKTYISVRGCTVTRSDGGLPPFAVAPRLRSECELDLIALKQSKGS